MRTSAVIAIVAVAGAFLAFTLWWKIAGPYKPAPLPIPEPKPIEVVEPPAPPKPKPQPITVICSECNGTGKRDGGECWACQGSGKLIQWIIEPKPVIVEPKTVLPSPDVPVSEPPASPPQAAPAKSRKVYSTPPRRRGLFQRIFNR